QEFQDLFKRSFKIAPAPYLPWDRIVNIRPSNQGADNADIDHLTVGREFLTWLWFRSEQRNGFIALPQEGDIECHFLRRLVLESGDGEYSETVVCQGLHSDLKEGKEALRQGKKIREARIRLGIDAASWEFTLKADQFHIQSLKLPMATDGEDAEEDREGALIERMYLIEKALTTLDRLFAFFVKLRLSADWSAEMTRMAKWVG
ncbi:MAG: hypothetical protein PHY31_01270, partial [Smithellaceae bacterium]|nr:hypothetical protein [Smithellaceae bacterium]